MIDDTDNLQKVFAEHFARDDLQGAMAWYQTWARQNFADKLPAAAEYSLRAMAGHVSDYLEGYDGTEPSSYGGSELCYYETKHGREIYANM